MKIKLKKKSRSLIKLHLLKYQIYKDNLNINLNNVNIELKQALKIIYLYNKKKKNILFIGFPFTTKLQNHLNQSFMSKIELEKKLQINNNKCLSNNNGKDFDLIVFNSTSSKDSKFMKELKKFNLPLILFGNFDSVLDVNTYNVKVSLNKNYMKKFCWFLIFSILTKKSKHDCYKKIQVSSSI